MENHRGLQGEGLPFHPRGWKPRVLETSRDFAVVLAGRKEAAGRFFKRQRFEAALERYSLAAEMLTQRDDIKEKPGPFSFLF